MHHDFPVEIGGCQECHPSGTSILILSNDTLLSSGLGSLLAHYGFCVTVRDVSDTSPPPERAAIVLVDQALKAALPRLFSILKGRDPCPRIVVLTRSADPAILAAFHRAGADGFCPVDVALDDVERAIRLAAAGHAVLPMEAMASLLGDRLEVPVDLPGRVETLSRREIEVFFWLPTGASNKEIARQLNVTEVTIKVHIKAILRKLGATNRTQAAIWATSFDPPDDFRSRLRRRSGKRAPDTT